MIILVPVTTCLLKLQEEKDTWMRQVHNFIKRLQSHQIIIIAILLLRVHLIIVNMLIILNMILSSVLCLAFPVIRIQTLRLKRKKVISMNKLTIINKI